MVIWYPLAAFALVYVTWVFYLAVMNLKRGRDAGKLTLPVKILGYPLLAVGLVCDFLANVLVFTVLLFELPRETLVTARLKRHVRAGGWRGKVCAWFAVNLLDAFDPDGRHV